MKNGIPCNEYYHTPKAKHDRIVYRFVNDDDTTPSSCTVRLGDTDPLTGETIADLDFFTEYYRLADHQIYVQGKETKNRLSLDGMVFDGGDSQADQMEELSMPAEDPFSENEPEDVLRLRELAQSLTGRLADVYEALLVRYAGGKERISMQEIADKWGVHLSQVYYDRNKIIRMIRERIGSSGK